MLRHPTWFLIGLLLFVALALSSWRGEVSAGVNNDQRDDWSSLTTGREVYEAACAACHGTRGTGTEQSMRGFDVQPPDFTDCAFSSREPAMDWYGIAHSGGPTKGFDRLMPAFSDVLSKRQIEAAVAHIKTYCRERRKWPVGEFNLAKPLNTGKAFPENEVAWSISTTVEEPFAVNGKFVVARRIGARHQIEAAVPVGVQQVERAQTDGATALEWGAGVGELVAAWKSVLWHSLRAGTIGSMTMDIFFPVGDEADGFSEGIFMFEPALAVAQLIPYVGFIQLQGGAELSTNTDEVPHGVFWRAAIGHTFRRNGFGRAWSPMVEILGATEIEDGAAVEWDIVPQLQVALSKRQHVRLGAGVLLPLTDFTERQLEIQAYLIWDWYDGGFTEGW
jgi:mono/diheme cytochrome c family protein